MQRILRIGVLEWASCGGAVGTARLPESIRCEGWAMCQAVIDSLLMASHIPVVCIAPDLFHRANSATRASLLRLDPARDVREQWRDAYAACDATIVVAPECDNVLLELEAWCATSGIRTCGSDALFIEHAGDKWLTANCLGQHHLPHPATQLLSDWTPEVAMPAGAQTWTLKARDGVGCEGMQRFDSTELAAFQTSCSAAERWIVQPWIEGQAFSRTAIVNAAGQYHWLPVVRQHLSIGRQVSYRGGHVLPDLCLTTEQTQVLERAIASLAGRARGWVGIDFLLTEDGQLIVIEINPRLTTSFVGLFKACDRSLADVLVRAALGMELSLEPLRFSSQEFSVT